MKKLTLILAFLPILLMVRAQDSTIYVQQRQHPLYLGVEGGIKIYDVVDPGYGFIRATALYNYAYYSYSSQLTWSAFTPEIAFKAEYRFPSDKFWIASGLSYVPMASRLWVSASGDNPDHFYLIHRQEGNELYYLRIREIEEWTHFLGIPLDLRYSPFLPRVFRLYFKASLDIQIRLASDKSVSFVDSSMENYEDEVLDMFQEGPPAYVLGSLGIGFQWGKQDRPNIRLEADFPSLIIGQPTFALMDHSIGGGINVSFILPLK